VYISSKGGRKDSNVETCGAVGNYPCKGILRSCLSCILPLEDVEKSNIQSATEVLLRRGRLDLKTIAQQAKLSLRITSEALTVLIQHGIVRWATVEDGSGEKTFYECIFEDVYPLIRLGKEVQLAEKHAGPEVLAP
jgi:RNA polymerase III subunit RPC82 helix-turn-helix domain